MEGGGWSLVAAAAGVALVHTVLGPDHYLPFVMLARARVWTPRRTAVITAACGLAHVIGSLVLAGIGVAAGMGLLRLEFVGAVRGNLAAWLLLAFGLAYALWGTRRAIRRSRGLVPHAHGRDVHLHSGGDRPHAHDACDAGRAGGAVAGRDATGEASFWALLAVFVLGPCEPLIPLLMLPASQGRWAVVAATVLAFSVITIGTMLGMVALGLYGLRPIRLAPLQHWSHALAGCVLAASGGAILWLGW